MLNISRIGKERLSPSVGNKVVSNTRKMSGKTSTGFSALNDLLTLHSKHICALAVTIVLYVDLRFAVKKGLQKLPTALKVKHGASDLPPELHFFACAV